MLKSLRLQDFTVFHNAQLRFGAGLNVIVGENGAGKTHILKAAYAGIAASAERGPGEEAPTSKAQLQNALTNKILGVLRPESLGRLVRRKRGRGKCEIEYAFSQPRLDFGYSFSTLAKTVSLSSSPRDRVDKLPVYLPTRELLTIYPGFVSLYETTHLPFEETWRDTCILLGAPLARGPRETRIRSLLAPLEAAMGGKVELDASGRFYLVEESGRLEMHLVAEGLRKLATIARLIATGALLDKGYLFWDEPESNLNPKIIKTVAKTILQVADSGIQVFVATHSLFLLRELHILKLREFPTMDTQCIGLHQNAAGVAVMQGPTMDGIGAIAALDEDVQQSERYIDTEMGVSVA